MHLIDFIYSNDAAEGISLVHAARAFNDLRCKFKTASAPPPRRAMIQFKIAFFPSIVSACTARAKRDERASDLVAFYFSLKSTFKAY
jgi:hypothetical protein